MLDGMLMVPRRLLLVSLVLWSFVSTGWAVQRVESQKFILPLAGTVAIDTYRGAIDVVPGEGREGQISVEMLSPNDDSEEARLAIDALQMSFEQVEGNATFKARNPSETGLKFIWEDQGNLAIRIKVTVPQEGNLDLVTYDGGIKVGDLRGGMKARIETGTIFFRRIDGNVDAQAESGDVVVSRSTESGNLRTVVGNVRIGMVGRHARLETDNGNIELQTAHGVVEANATEGDIDAGFATITGQSRIVTKVGNITATMNPSESFSIEAKACWEKVRNQLAIQTNKDGSGRKHLNGDYNGGGRLIELKASGGSVSINSDPYIDG